MDKDEIRKILSRMMVIVTQIESKQLRHELSNLVYQIENELDNDNDNDYQASC